MQDFTFKHKDNHKELTFRAIDWKTAWTILAEYEYVAVDIVKLCWDAVVPSNCLSPFPSLPKEKTWSEVSTEQATYIKVVMVDGTEEHYTSLVDCVSALSLVSSDEIAAIYDINGGIVVKALHRYIPESGNNKCKQLAKLLNDI